MGAEVTKLIDYIISRFECQKLTRREFVRNDASHLPPITAPPRNLHNRSIATLRLLHLTPNNRSELHLPFYSAGPMSAC